MLTCDDKLIISLRNHGTHVRDNIDKIAKNAIRITNLEKIKSIIVKNYNIRNQHSEKI